MFPSCMSLLSRRQENAPPRPGQTAVVLNVYDMYWTNWYTAGAGVGVFHSGVQVHGSEWAYGGHPYSFTGVFEISPRDSRELGDQFRFRQSVHIGYTDFSEEEVRRLVAELGKQFRGDRYHLMNNNCNHFSSAFCQALCSRDIPAWVNRLAYVSSCVPFLQRCLPKEWLTPAALRQSLEAHSRSSTPQTPQ
ncbi:deubiquitinase DESI2 isoform X6 [Pectinophora gossypiella]|nr:deubiquitinase DESI2 isoform X6 [Pectinophora gossypiella]